MEKLHPEKIDPSLPKNVIDAHAKIAADLAKVQLDYTKTINERDRLRSGLADSFDLGAMEQVRKLAGKANMLLQEELNIRAELGRWFPVYHDALNDLYSAMVEAKAQAHAKAKAQLASIGFQEEEVSMPGRPVDHAKYLYKEMIETHPSVCALAARIRSISMAADSMLNPGLEGSPVRYNRDAVERIAGKIREVLARQEQLLALL